MQYDFLNQFPKRMKSVGRYVMLIKNSAQKTTWKQFGIQSLDEQINLIFSVLLYIMEVSLKDDFCTIDDIVLFLDEINQSYYKKEISYKNCRELADFIINTVLCDEGRAMYFTGYDYEEKQYQTLNISYVANRIVYIDEEVRRTSYYLTDDGYNLMLSTLELENHMKLTIHEIIFKLHLEKASYDKAVEDIKNIFNLMRIQLQKVQEAMRKIRQNALNYTTEDYKNILEENLETISDTKKQLSFYKDVVRSRVDELEKQNIDIRRLSMEDEKNLSNLKIIESYLNRSIDEHQKILNAHFDLKELYAAELDTLSQMTMIKRFDFRGELYDKVLQNVEMLSRIDYFFRPLFSKTVTKSYNLNKAFEIQRVIRRKGSMDEEEELLFEEEEYYAEQELKIKEKLRHYSESTGFLLKELWKKKSLTLEELKEVSVASGHMDTLIPTVEIFREIMIELLSAKEIDISALKLERSQYIQERSQTFQLNETILNLVEQEETLQEIKKIYTYKSEDGTTVLFEQVVSEDGTRKNIRCSNLRIYCI